MSVGTCKGCGRRIVWGKTPEGKRIPLDPSAPTYYYTEGEDLITRTMPAGDPPTKIAVSHFATCPKASEFSGSREL